MIEPSIFGYGETIGGENSSGLSWLLGKTDLEEPQSESGGSTTATLNYIINVYIDGFLCLIGFTGNILILHILGTDQHKSSNTLFLLVLAVYDILILVFTVFYTLLRSIYPATGALQNYFDNASPFVIAYVLPIGWIAQTGCIWFTALAAGDRYFAINFPLKAAQVCTLSRAKKITIAASVSAVLFNFPRFLHYHLVAFYGNGANSTFVSHIKLDLPEWNSQLYHYLYHISLTFVFLYIIPLGALVFFNIQLIRALNRTGKFRKHTTSNKGNNAKRISHQVTLNLVIMITKFIICQTPDFIAAILGAIPTIKSSQGFMVFSIFKEMLIVFNSSVNFYIYLIFNQRFRHRMRGMLRCKYLREKAEQTSSNGTSSTHITRTRLLSQESECGMNSVSRSVSTEEVQPVVLKSYINYGLDEM